MGAEERPEEVQDGRTVARHDSSHPVHRSHRLLRGENDYGNKDDKHGLAPLPKIFESESQGRDLREPEAVRSVDARG